jgi:phage gp45-like
MTVARMIQQIAKSKDEVYSQIAKVIAVDKAERTCAVEPANGDAEIYDVRLQAVISGSNGFVLIPKVGSDVIVTFLGKETAHVTMVAEVESFSLIVDKQELLYDNKGLSVKSSSSDLKTEFNNVVNCISSLVDILVKFQLTTNVGATIAVMPNIIAELQQQKANLAQYKQKINTFLQ